MRSYGMVVQRLLGKATISGFEHIFKPFDQQADHEHRKPVSGESIHNVHRGNKDCAAPYFRSIAPCLTR